MKKYFIIAAAALVALAACNKVEKTEAVDVPISFQVANFVGQTKAGESLFPIDSTFFTYSWFHENATATAQAFMAAEEVRWQATPKQWASNRAYFWPKTGWLNFFSYTGYPRPSTVTEGSVKYTNVAITDTTNDAMLASAAYRYSKNENVYAGDDYKYSGTDVEGVPTLFHHLLAQVSVIVKFDASEVADTDYKWDLKINSASLSYAKQGSLDVTFTDPTSKGQAWPYTTPAVNWVAATGVANLDLAAAENLGEDNKQTTVAPNVSAGKNLFTTISVMPQDLTAATGSDAKFAINYTLTSYYQNVQHITETVDLTGANAIPLTSFTYDVSGTPTTLNQWNMNYRYTYIITIKPNKTVTFDPVVEPWVDEANQPGYTYPND